MSQLPRHLNYFQRYLQAPVEAAPQKAATSAAPFEAAGQAAREGTFERASGSPLISPEIEGIETPGKLGKKGLYQGCGNTNTTCSFVYR
jgi:hypothetical protein